MNIDLARAGASYAGIGSRETPGQILAVMRSAASLLASRGWILRSGGALGADTAFEAGAGALKEIYLPWPGFCQRHDGVARPTQGAIALARTVHPAWGRLKRGAQMLHARNCHQVLGRDLRSPVEFVLCWTPDGACTEAGCSIQTGGTATAIRLADRHGIPVYNLRRPVVLDGLIRTIQQARSVMGKRPFPAASHRKPVPVGVSTIAEETLLGLHEQLRDR